MRDKGARTVARREKHRQRRALRIAVGGAAPAVVALGAIPAFADYSDPVVDEQGDGQADVIAVDAVMHPDDLDDAFEGTGEIVGYEPDDSLQSDPAADTEAGEPSNDSEEEQLEGSSE